MLVLARIGERGVGTWQAVIELGGQEEFETPEWLQPKLQVLPP